MTFVAAWVALAGMALSTYNTRQTAKRADRATAAGIANQRKIQERSNSAINQAADQLKKSSATKEKAAKNQRYLDALKSAGVGGSVAGARPSGGSSAYRDAMSTAAANESASATDLAGLYAATDAPLDQRLGESFAIGDLGVDLGTQGSISRGQAGMDQLLIQRAGRRDPWMDLASQAAMGYASYGGGTGGGGGG